MPWVKQELCNGCGVCIDECPVGAMKMETDDCAAIEAAECIRCGQCHDVCPQDAVRHDSELVPREIAANLQWVRDLLVHFREPAEQAAFMDRMVRFFNKQKKVSEETIAFIKAAGDDPANGIENAIRALFEQANQTARTRRHQRQRGYGQDLYRCFVRFTR
jgi:ferredoxin